jgi:ketosteroid isomerase-like protein
MDEAGRPAYYGNPAGVTEDLAVVQAIYAAFGRRDVEGVVRHLTPDCELHFEGTGRVLGRERPYLGHAGAREYFGDVALAWDDLELHTNDFRLIPGSVIVIGHVTGRRHGELVRRASVWTWQLQDGKVSSVRASDMGELPET